ncbi:hypothetical protein LUZ62_064875 [Rhynchospora pubera]|uniref:Uncharacterized protein n=1 Tax=Rhynchospora pubera TaxID=906938 RepID=A0AAV8EQP8_9POAL|nr:hypothetical protein LUZ62_064875 [Rhynchospora pubera]
MEEFLETEVMWSETIYSDSIDPTETISDEDDVRSRDSYHGNGSTPSSPITIPSSLCCHHSRERDDWCNEEEITELVPPHVILSQRNDENMSFSLQSGRGRTRLKGRDLCYIRKTVWRMTGFVDG